MIREGEGHDANSDLQFFENVHSGVEITNFEIEIKMFWFHAIG